MGRLPNFICAGAQRSGTTSLYEILKLHPSISLSKTKEVHFFDKDENYKKGINWYEEFFHNNGGICGELTPDYMLYNYVPERIKSTLGSDVKLIFLLRNPILRAYSQFNFHLSLGVEKDTDFINKINSEYIDLVNSNYFNFYTPPYYISRGLYFNQIKRFLKYFEKKNMHFILFEDLYGENYQFYINEIFTFLGIEKFNLNLPKKEESIKIPSNRFFLRILSKIKSQNQILKIIPKNYYEFSKSLFLKEISKEVCKLDKKDIKELNSRFFKEDIKSLQDLLEKDLSSWL